MKQFRLKHAPLPKLSENDVERQCLDLLRVRGWYVIRLQTGLFKTADNRWIKVGTKGMPDYVAIHPRYPAFLLETKRPGKALREEQAKLHWELTQAYRLAVVTIDGVERLTPWLDKHEGK